MKNLRFLPLILLCACDFSFLLGPKQWCGKWYSEETVSMYDPNTGELWARSVRVRWEIEGCFSYDPATKGWIKE